MKKHVELLFFLLLNIFLASSATILDFIYEISNTLTVEVFKSNPQSNDFCPAAIYIILLLCCIIFKFSIFPLIYYLKKIFSNTHKIFDKILNDINFCKKYLIFIVCFDLLIIALDLFYFNENKFNIRTLLETYFFTGGAIISYASLIAINTIKNPN